MNEATITTRDGREITVKVGDWVGFKSDYEQSGQVTKIEKRRGMFGGTGNGYEFTLTNPDGFGGEYLRYATETTIHDDEIF